MNILVGDKLDTWRFIAGRCWENHWQIPAMVDYRRVITPKYPRNLLRRRNFSWTLNQTFINTPLLMVKSQFFGVKTPFFDITDMVYKRNPIKTI